MSWDPKVNVVDVRTIRDNLIGHLKANQGDALVWANGGRVLPEIKKFFKTPQLVTEFPAITFLQFNHKSKWESILDIDLEVVFETAIVHGKKEVLADLGPKYSMAVESMLVNVPETTFRTGSIIDIESTSIGVETVFAVQGKYKNQFIEVFQTRASWHIEASAFAS